MITIPVSLNAVDPANQTVAAEYCTPVLHTQTVDTLVAGATYNHEYWDPPVDHGAYSFVRYDLLAGHATLAIDRIGTGQSSHPPSADLTISVDAYVLHQAIAYVRAEGYTQVNVIGHSLGAVVAATDANEWPGDPTRLVLTGYLNSYAPFTADPASIASTLYPAVFDPLFADSGLDEDYFTTVPNARGQMFYYPATENQAVVNWDEANKDVIALNEVEELNPIGVNPANTSSITVPVLILDGQDDLLFCVNNSQVNCASWSAMKAAEEPFFPSVSSLTAESVPETGHALALATSAPVSFGLIAAWLGTH